MTFPNNNAADQTPITMRICRLPVRAANEFRSFYFHSICFLLYHFYSHLQVASDISQPSELIIHYSFLICSLLSAAAVMTPFAHSAHYFRLFSQCSHASWLSDAAVYLPLCPPPYAFALPHVLPPGLTVFQLRDAVVGGVEPLVDLLVLALSLFPHGLALLLQHLYLPLQLAVQVLHPPGALSTAGGVLRWVFGGSGGSRGSRGRRAAAARRSSCRRGGCTAGGWRRSLDGVTSRTAAAASVAAACTHGCVGEVQRSRTYLCLQEREKGIRAGLQKGFFQVAVVERECWSDICRPTALGRD